MIERARKATRALFPLRMARVYRLDAHEALCAVFELDDIEHCACALKPAQDAEGLFEGVGGVERKKVFFDAMQLRHSHAPHDSANHALGVLVVLSRNKLRPVLSVDDKSKMRRGREIHEVFVEAKFVLEEELLEALKISS